jgi:predicted transcriptional regulator
MSWKRSEWKQIQNRIIQYLEENPTSTLPEISRATGIARGDTKTVIRQLRNEKKLQINIVRAYSMNESI